MFCSALTWLVLPQVLFLFPYCSPPLYLRCTSGQSLFHFYLESNQSTHLDSANLQSLPTRPPPAREQTHNFNLVYLGCCNPHSSFQVSSKPTTKQDLSSLLRFRNVKSSLQTLITCSSSDPAPVPPNSQTWLNLWLSLVTCHYLPFKTSLLSCCLGLSLESRVARNQT